MAQWGAVRIVSRGGSLPERPYTRFPGLAARKGPRASDTADTAVVDRLRTPFPLARPSRARIGRRPAWCLSRRLHQDRLEPDPLRRRARRFLPVDLPLHHRTQRGAPGQLTLRHPHLESGRRGPCRSRPHSGLFWRALPFHRARCSCMPRICMHGRHIRLQLPQLALSQRAYAFRPNPASRGRRPLGSGQVIVPDNAEFVELLDDVTHRQASGKQRMALRRPFSAA